METKDSDCKPTACSKVQRKMLSLLYPYKMFPSMKKVLKFLCMLFGFFFEAIFPPLLATEQSYFNSTQNCAFCFLQTL